MKVVIIEDEPLAAQKLAGYITRYAATNEIVQVLSRVTDVIDYFEQAREVDLIFSDIELLDGEVFSALDAIDLPCPIIFTTSYNEFWTQAFDNQGVAYLLKPFTYKRFASAMSNYEQLKNSLATRAEPKEETAKRYKSRFLLKKGQVVDIFKTDDVVCVRATSGVLSAYDNEGNHHLLTGSSMTELEAQLDPCMFFRVNRSEIVNINYVLSFENYGKETLAIKMQHMNEPVITSKTRTSEFRKWLAM